MHHVSRVRVADLNENLACGICFCYIIDATTIVECLHSFCRSCLVQYLERDNCCPLCGQLVHKTKPLDYIRTDTTLQSIIYKLVPGLYENEMERRRQFYASHPEAEPRPGLPEAEEQRGIVDPERLSATSLEADDTISVCLQTACRFQCPGNTVGIPAGYKRYLLCHPYMPVSHLKKFVRLKFDLPPEQKISVFYTDEDLPDYYSLSDVAELYSWRRMAPLELFYVVWHPFASRHSLKSSRRHLKFSKKFWRHRKHLSKKYVICGKVSNRPSSVESLMSKLSGESNECERPLVIDGDEGNFHTSSIGNVADAHLEDQLSPNRVSRWDAVRTSSSNTNSLPATAGGINSRPPTVCGVTASESSGAKKVNSIWRLVDERMDQSLPEADDSVDKSAQIFSRSEDETLYSPRFFGDRWSSVDRQTVVASSTTFAERYFRPICPSDETSCDEPSTNAATTHLPLSSSETPSSEVVSSPTSPNPTYAHFKKRLLLSTTSGGGKTDRNRVNCDPLIIGRSPVVTSFVIHEDQPTSSSSSVAAAPPATEAPLTRALSSSLSPGGVSPAPAKIGIVISHGRAMTLQDKLQRMNSSSPAFPPPRAEPSPPTPSSSCSRLVVDAGTAPSASTAVFHRKEAIGHRSIDRQRKRSRRRAAKRSMLRTPKWPAPAISSAENEIENETANRLSTTSSLSSAKRPCHRKRSELQLLLQLDGGPLAAAAEFRRANALRSRDNHQQIVESDSSGMRSKTATPAPSRILAPSVACSSDTEHLLSKSMDVDRPCGNDVAVAEEPEVAGQTCDNGDAFDVARTSGDTLFPIERPRLFDLAF